MISRLATLLSIVVIAASPVFADWEENGTSVGGGGYPHLVSDGSGGTIIAWESWDPWAGQWDYGYGQRLSPGGDAMWLTPDFDNFCESSDQSAPLVTTDGAGGGIFVWFDNRNGYLDLYAQRIDAAGAPQWGECGVPVRVLPKDLQTYSSLAIVSDGAGGAIIAWSDPRGSNSDIYAQHLNASGVALWTTNGGTLCFAAGEQVNPVGVSDGAGGAWFAWVDSRSGVNDIYARHINSAGVPSGIPGGLALCTAAGSQAVARIAPDEAGGAIVSWQDSRGGGSSDDIYAQRVSAAGSVLWTADGVGVCTQASMQEFPEIASDGTGGAVVVWKDWRTYPGTSQMAVFAQRVDETGASQWTADGNLLGVSDRLWGVKAVVVPDGYGNSLVAWSSALYSPVLLDMEPFVRVQRLGANGAEQWAAGGVDVRHSTGFPGDSGVDGLVLIADGWGGAYAAWQDWRYWQASSVHVAHVSPSGVATDAGPVRVPSLKVADVYPNPFSGQASLAIELATPSRLEVDIFDVRGRKVSSLVRENGNLSHVVELNGRDEAGRLLPSGVYFCRVRNAGETVTRKMVITR